MDAKDKFNMPERKTREEIRKEEDDAKWRTQIEMKQDFLQFQFFSDIKRRDLIGESKIPKKESDFQRMKKSLKTSEKRKGQEWI